MKHIGPVLVRRHYKPQEMKALEQLDLALTALSEAGLCLAVEGLVGVGSQWATQKYIEGVYLGTNIEPLAHKALINLQ